LVDREDHHRQGDPRHEEDDSDPGEVMGHGFGSQRVEHAQMAAGRPPGDPADETEYQRQSDLALAVGSEAVPEQPGFQTGEFSNHAIPRSSSAPPTAAM